MNKPLLLSMALLACTTMSFAKAENINFQAVKDGTVVNLSSSQNISPHRQFKRIVLSPEAKLALSHRQLTTNISEVSFGLPISEDLGMNNVPVLNQGEHGTCVTFASTAAIDAILGQGDYISQLCNLELGTTLEETDPDHWSGWNNSWGDIVLNQIKDYGIITKVSQTKEGCAGVFDYPTHEPDNWGKPMSVADFKQRSENMNNHFSFRAIMPHDIALSDKMNPPRLLRSIKQAINKGHRVIFCILLDVKRGHDGAFGTYQVTNDSWILTPEIIKDIKEANIDTGHEMIITGYDDNAVITGPDHSKHIGAFILRNSWGEYAGNHGTYYMSYDHFAALVMEVHEIMPV